MLKYLKCLLFNIVILITSTICLAQDADSASFKKVDPAQGVFNNIVLNPAFTGIFYGHNLQSSSRLSDPFYNYRHYKHPFSLNVSYNMAFGKNINHAMGIFYDASQGGVYQRNSVAINYAYSKTLFMTKSFYHKLRIGASLVYHKLSYEKFNYYTFGDMIDPKYGFIYNTNEYNYYSADDTLKYIAGLNLGLWYHNPFGYFGVATNSLSLRDTSSKAFYVKPFSFNIAAGGHVYIGDNWALHPSINIQYVANDHSGLSTLSPAITASYQEKIYIGFSYTDFNKPSYLLGFTLKQKYTLLAKCGLYKMFSTDYLDLAYFEAQLNLKFK
ncbi:MAG: hypothetical protein PHT69_07045 [Bacteroidales bacterium]|nr:hypothetical protein [Bacteroidales bacterium]